MSSVPTLFDQYGRPLGKGDALITLSTEPIIWVVSDIVPVMHPKAPPNTLQVVMTSLFQAPCQGGKPTHGFIRIMTAEEAQQQQEAMRPSRILS